MEQAIAHEVERQMDILEDGGSITQETRLYNGDRDESRSMRTKEEANDYRYFPCPDLLPVEIDDAFIEDSNWIQGEFSARLNAEEKSVAEAPITGAQLGAMVTRIADNTLSSAGAKKVFEALWTGENDDVDAIIEAKGLKQVSDTGALESMVDEVLAGMPDQVAQYQGEEDPKKRKKMLGGFMGPLMKASKGQGNPKLFNEILVRKLGG